MTAHAIRRPTSWARGAARQLLLDRNLDHWLGTIDPVLSLSVGRARVTRIRDETHDVKTFTLAPNRRWRGHRAGQYCVIGVEIDGVQQRRCYSLSSPPGAVEITVKRVPNGLVSGWLHDHARVGDVVECGRAAGGFIVPPAPPDKLLLYTGGSGVTPAMSIIRDLDRRDQIGDVVFIHHARSRRDVIFADELAELATRHPQLRLIVRLDDQHGARGHDWLAAEVPDFAQRSTYLCGPSGLMAAVEARWRQAGASDRLTIERFASPQPPTTATGDTVALALTRSGRALTAATDRSLLDSIIASGAPVKYGCQMGICKTCMCRKRSGTVRDILTGELSSTADENIRLCVSAPTTDIELAL